MSLSIVFINSRICLHFEQV